MEKAIVNIANELGLTVGSGFLISDSLVLTLPRVINRALERPYFSNVQPTSIEAIQIIFPRLVTETSYTGQVVAWNGANPAKSLAILSLSSPAPPEAVPLQFIDIADQDNHMANVVAFPFGNSHATWIFGRLGNLNARHNGYQFDGGKAPSNKVPQVFSGAPVWNDDELAVIGLLVTSNDLAETEIDLVISAETIFEFIAQSNLPSDRLPMWVNEQITQANRSLPNQRKKGANSANINSIFVLGWLVLFVVGAFFTSSLSSSKEEVEEVEVIEVTVIITQNPPATPTIINTLVPSPPATIFSVEQAFDLGLRAYRNRNFDEAVYYFEEAISLREDDYTTLSYLATSYVQLEQYETAVRYYEEVETLLPSYSRFQLYRGIAYFEVGYYEKAIENLEKLPASARTNEILNKAYEALENQ